MDFTASVVSIVLGVSGRLSHDARQLLRKFSAGRRSTLKGDTAAALLSLGMAAVPRSP